MNQRAHDQQLPVNRENKMRQRIAFGLLVGVALGVVHGVIFDSIVLGIAIGVGSGLSIGVAIGASSSQPKRQPSKRVRLVLLGLVFVTGVAVLLTIALLLNTIEPHWWCDYPALNLIPEC